MKAPKEAYYSLATVLCKAFELNEVKKGKALPVGTTRNWGNKDYIKTNSGWKPKGGGKPAQVKGKPKQKPTNMATGKKKQQPKEAPKDKKNTENIRSQIKDKIKNIGEGQYYFYPHKPKGTSPKIQVQNEGNKIAIYPFESAESRIEFDNIDDAVSYIESKMNYDKEEKSVQKGCGKKVKKMGIGTLTTTGNRDQEIDQNRGAMLLEKVKPVEKTSKKLMAYKTLEQILAKAIEYIETDQTLPTGTKRVWKNKTYIKTEKGWSYKE